MSRLGFERETGFVFEGRGDPRFPVWPTPIVSHATLISGPADFPKIPTSFESAPFGWLFQEDSFDPVSRVRRGRLFQKMGGDGWGGVNVEAHPASHSDMKRIASNGLVQRSLSIFIQCQELLAGENRGIGAQLALGAASSYSLWRIVQVEITLNEDVMLTLRAESALGVLPEIDLSKIPPESVTSVKSALSRVLDAAYRELPSSVVDQCRNAATVVEQPPFQSDIVLS